VKHTADRTELGEAVHIIGVDIGGTKCRVCLADMDGTVRQARQFPTSDRDQTLSLLFQNIEQLSPGARPLFGVACGGPLDAERGLILSPPNLPGWDNVPIVKMLLDRFGGEAYLMNDANASALAEWRFGAGRGYENMVFLTHGTGMGAGLIFNNSLYEGASGMAGEVGHVRLAEVGPIGHGKEGSVEGFCSGGGIAKLAQRKAATLTGGLTFGPDDIKTLTARDVGEAAEGGNPVAQEILEDSGRCLGHALSILIDLLNPQVIVLGSLYVRYQRFIEPPMRAVINRECLPHTLRACRIVPAQLGTRIGDYAAICAALYRSRRW